MQSSAVRDALMSIIRSESLSPAHRRIGQWILDHPREAMFLSSVELAKRVEVSQASVVRFAVAIGYDGYRDLQRRIRELVGALPDEQGSVSSNRHQEAVAHAQRSLEGLANELADDSLARLGGELARANGMVVVGMRHAGALASYFGYLAAKLHPRVDVVTSGGRAAHELVLRAHRDGAEWLVAFALPRYPIELVNLLHTANDAGLRILTISDSHAVPLIQISEVLVAAPMGHELVFDVPITPLMYAGLLLDAMREADPRRSQERLDDEDRFALDAGTYL